MLWIYADHIVDISGLPIEVFHSEATGLSATIYATGRRRRKRSDVREVALEAEMRKRAGQEVIELLVFRLDAAGSLPIALKSGLSSSQRQLRPNLQSRFDMEVDRLRLSVVFSPNVQMVCAKRVAVCQFVQRQGLVAYRTFGVRHTPAAGGAYSFLENDRVAGAVGACAQRRLAAVRHGDVHVAIKVVRKRLLDHGPNVGCGATAGAMDDGVILNLIFGVALLDKRRTAFRAGDVADRIRHRARDPLDRLQACPAADDFGREDFVGLKQDFPAVARAELPGRAPRRP